MGIARWLSGWIGRPGRPAAGKPRVEPGSPPLLEPIALTPPQREAVERRLAGYIDGEFSLPSDHRAAAEAAMALPILLDWFGFFGLRPDGDVVWVPSKDGPGVVSILRDARLRRFALKRGTELHPGLGFLLPARPPDAVPCPSCGGSGRILLPAGREWLADRLVCSCGGLGWIPAGER